MPEPLGQALLIANANYSDLTLNALIGTEVDIRALESVLADPAIGDYQVQTSLDESIHRLRQRIERFFVQAHKDSLLLLYLSGHGIKDRDGKLYFAATDTESNMLMSTGLAAGFIHEASERSRCRRQIFIFDACFSGAFARGYIHKSDQKVHAHESFRDGTGKIIITASDDMQYAFLGDEIEGCASTSIFTRYLVEGLRTGDAANETEIITADRLYQYVYEQVLKENPAQKPQFWSFGLSGDLMLARNPSQKLKKLPDEIVELLEDPKPKVRMFGIDELKKLLVEPSFHQAINVALKKLSYDDSKIVSTKATEVQAELEELQKEAESKDEATVEVRQQTPLFHIPVLESKCQPEAEVEQPSEEEGNRNAEINLQTVEECMNQMSGSLEPFDAALLETVRQDLVIHLGPIAKVLIKQAATRALTVPELYEQLAEHIPTLAGRAAFLNRGRKHEG